MAISKVNSPYTKIQDVPDVPTIGTATEGAGSAEVAFTPATTGGRAYQYRALSSPGGIEAVGFSSPITVTGLTADVTYNFQVRAETNTGATNGYSGSSNDVIPTSLGDYELLETQILASSASSVTFTGLDSYTDYKHLRLRAVTRTTRSATNDVVLMTFNSDTGANYAYHELRGNGSSVSSGAGTSQNNLRLSISQTSDNGANAFSPVVADILDFSSTTKNTTVRSLSGMTETNNFIDLRSGLWNDTSAVTSFTLDNFGTGFEIGCRFSLYGLRAA